MMIIWGVPKHSYTGGNEYLIRLDEAMTGPGVTIHTFDNSNYRKLEQVVKFVRIMVSTPSRTLVLPSTASYERIFMQLYKLLIRDIEIVVVCQDVWFIQDTGWRRLRRILLRNDKIHYLCCSYKVAEAQSTYFQANHDLCKVVNPATELTNEGLKRNRNANLLVVGSVIPRKHTIETVEAFCSSGYSGKLVIIGSLDSHPDYVQSIKQLVKKADKCGQVVFTGNISKDELATHLTDSTALVHFVKDEAYGMVMLEALCCGTPVLCHEDVTEEFQNLQGVFTSNCLDELFKKLCDPTQIGSLVTDAESQSDILRSANTWQLFQKEVASYLHNINREVEK